MGRAKEDQTIVGLWIDHRKAIIVAVTEKGEETALIISKVEKQLRRPGEAKGELKERLEKHKLGKRIADIETVDKMTDRQIAAKVRKFFPK